MFLSTCESVMTVRIFTVMSAEDMAPFARRKTLKSTNWERRLFTIEIG